MLINRNDTLEEVVGNTLRQIKRGVVDRKHPFRFVSFATRGNQNINNRLVVLRKYTEDHRLIFFTDQRSHKVRDLELDPTTTLLFWHPGKKVQVIIKGKSTLHIKNEFSAEFWNGISIEGRKAYGSTLSPGERVNHIEEAHHWPEMIGDDQFTVIEFQPNELEVLQLHKLSHYRARFSLDGGSWSGSWVVP